MDDFQEFSSADYVGGALSRFAYFKLYGINKNSAEPSCQLLQASLYLWFYESFYQWLYLWVFTWMQPCALKALKRKKKK